MGEPISDKTLAELERLSDLRTVTITGDLARDLVVEVRVGRIALANARTEAEMWESWAGSLRDALDSLVTATRGELGRDHPLIQRAEDVLTNG